MLTPFCASANDATGLLLVFEVGVEQAHDGIRRMGRHNLPGALAADQRQDRRTLRTHPTRRPREDILLPEQNVISVPAVFLRSPPPVQATLGMAALSLLQRNSLPSTHIRCRTTARRLATATMARPIPRRCATRMPHAFSHDHLLPWVARTWPASSSTAPSLRSLNLHTLPPQSLSPNC